MHIVSYRGPGQAGGVSAALARAWDSDLTPGELWWHVEGNGLKVSNGADHMSKDYATLPEDVVKGHYRFCNEFLWPIMHDLPQYARYDEADRGLYDYFNQAFGWCLIRSHGSSQPANFFIQDYQLAILPAFIHEHAGFRSLVFWHIPWPKHVEKEHARHLRGIVRSLLSAEAIGFHTQEYADNFLAYVREHLPEFHTKSETLEVSAEHTISRIAPVRNTVPPSGRNARQAHIQKGRTTKLIVAPLGIDTEYWSSLASKNQKTIFHPALVRTPFVLSVDRADYTKAVTDRMRAIDKFFEKHPEWIGKITFAQISGKTRPGLAAFDEYWNECHQLYARLKDRWSTPSWQPLAWIETSFSSAQLATVYRSAEAMLITAVRDGLNLTAKEYIACQSRVDPGVLILSKGAGAAHELGKYSVLVEPANPEQMAQSIYTALTMDQHERAWRMAVLKEQLKSNTLESWWSTFANILEPNSTRYLRETS